MYQIDKDKLVPIPGIPRPSTVGMPQIFARADRLMLGYETFNASETTAVTLAFDGAVAHFLGPPNDEALSSHPLFAIGLEPYSVQEVTESSWLHSLQASGAFSAVLGQQYRHFLITFHDGVFECLARTVAVASDSKQPVEKALLDAISSWRE